MWAMMPVGLGIYKFFLPSRQTLMRIFAFSSIKCVVHCVCDREGAECGCRLLCG